LRREASGRHFAAHRRAFFEKRTLAVFRCGTLDAKRLSENRGGFSLSRRGRLIGGRDKEIEVNFRADNENRQFVCAFPANGCKSVEYYSLEINYLLPKS
jgi:hypothetical protein